MTQISDRPNKPPSGWIMLAIVLAMLAGAIALSLQWLTGNPSLSPLWFFGAAAILSGGFIAIEPNEAAVLTLFGAYRGSVLANGFFWTNPFYRKRKISLRARNFNSEILKVNDNRGNPIEIAAVVVWHVEDAAKALFEVNAYDHYVAIQSETALRHLASLYTYDRSDDEDGATLQSGSPQVLQTLTVELQERLSRAGVSVEDARLSHLAYAPEIAGAMLRRQQAEAIVAARQKIVHGAVGIVRTALEELEGQSIITFTDEGKTALVSNLLVVLCSESEVHPIVNAGSKAHDQRH